jgi:pimeloyl-ACP methyl ester carboxylesterase
VTDRLTLTSATVPGWGIRTEVLRGGQGDPVVLLHGDFPPSPTDPLALGLARHHEVIAPVHPGFRHPDDADALHDVHDVALYHDDLLASLGLGAVPVVGHSFGGMVAAELAAHVPGRVSRLALIAPYGLWRDDEPVADLLAAFPLELAPLLWADPAGEAAQAAMVALVGEDDDDPPAGDSPAPLTQPGAGGTGEAASATAVQSPPEVQVPPAARALQRMLPGLATVGRFLWPLPDKGLARRLHRVGAPTLIIWGAEDRLIPPSYAADLSGRIPGSRVELVAGAGHMVTAEHPDEVARLLEQFIR